MMFTFSLPFTQVLLIFFLFMLLIATIYSWILIYHWHTYGQSKVITAVTTLLYLIGVAGCIGVMLTAVLISMTP